MQAWSSSGSTLEGEEEVDEARQLIELYRRQAIAVSVIDLTAYEIGNALLRGRPHIAADRVAIVIESPVRDLPAIDAVRGRADQPL